MYKPLHRPRGLELRLDQRSNRRGGGCELNDHHTGRIHIVALTGVSLLTGTGGWDMTLAQPCPHHLRSARGTFSLHSVLKFNINVQAQESPAPPASHLGLAGPTTRPSRRALPPTATILELILRRRLVRVLSRTPRPAAMSNQQCA